MSEFNYTLRQAECEDIEQFKTIYCAMYQYLISCGLPYELNMDKLEDNLNLQLKAKNRAVFLLVEAPESNQENAEGMNRNSTDDNVERISGFIAVEVQRMGRRMSSEGINILGHVSEIYVSPDFRGGGRAAKLLNAAEEWCREAGAGLMECEVLNQNEKGLEFWNSAGYKPQYQIFNKKF